jgi:hypothetical protein
MRNPNQVQQPAEKSLWLAHIMGWGEIELMGVYENHNEQGNNPRETVVLLFDHHKDNQSPIYTVK